MPSVMHSAASRTAARVCVPSAGTQPVSLPYPPRRPQFAGVMPVFHWSFSSEHSLTRAPICCAVLRIEEAVLAFLDGDKDSLLTSALTTYDVSPITF